MTHFSIHKIWLLLLLPLVAIIFHYLLFLPWPCATLASALGCVTWAMQQLIWNILLKNELAMLVPLCTLALVGAIYFWKKGLLPENYSQFLVADGNKCRLSLYLWATTFLFLLLAGWITYLLIRQTVFDQTDQVILTLATLFLWAILLLFVRGNAHHFVDQIEVLVDKQYQAELQNFMQVIRSQRHDFNFHLQAISAMLEQKQYDECQTYINTMVQNASRTNDILLLRSPAISAMLSTFQEIALQKALIWKLRSITTFSTFPAPFMNSIPSSAI